MSFDDSMSVEEQAARLVVSDTDGLARRVRDMGGSSFGVPHLTPDQELWAWTHPDDTIDEQDLIARGMAPSEAASHKYPLQAKLMEQAGRTFDEQAKYAQRMHERMLRAQEAGRVPKPPPRQGGIHTPALKPPREGI